MRVFAALLCIASIGVVAQEARKFSEAEIVDFLNQNGYSIVSDDNQDVTLSYHSKRKTWSLRVQGKCSKPKCVCIDCESFVTVIETPSGLRMGGIVLDG